MDESILLTIKKLIGIAPDDTSFDLDLIVHINTVLSILTQLGVSEDYFSINGPDEKWKDYLGSNNKLSLVETYMYLKLKPWFDSGMSSTVINAFAESAKELEFRISTTVDPWR